LADLSHYLKFDLKIRPQQQHWSLGGNHHLVMGEAPMNSPPGAIDVSSVYANLRLAGSKSREVLRKLTSLNVGDAALPNLRCAQASVADVHTIVLREDLGTLPAFHLLVTREYAESAWEAIVRAGQEFHLCGCGLTALHML
jgi:heterotetrameric sarcosine oxidase gamma subunit